MLLFITLVSSTKTHLRFTPDRIVLLLSGAFFVLTICGLVVVPGCGL